MKLYVHTSSRIIASKVTLRDVKDCFYGVPKHLYNIRKTDSGDIIVTIQDEMHKHWYAMSKLYNRFTVYHDDPLSNDYIITASNSIIAWTDTSGEYHTPEKLGKREVLREARRLGARNVSNIGFSEANKLLSEGFECICYSKDTYGNTSACVCGKNVATTGFPRDDEEYIYTDKPNAASAILSGR